MCGVFRGGRMPTRKIPPAPRTGFEASGAQAGFAFFAPGFCAQAKKVGSRRRGAKALDLGLRQQQWEQDTPTADPAAKRKARRGRSPDLRCCRGGGGGATMIWPAAKALIVRDLRLLWRRRGDALQPALFALLVIVLFALALGNEPRTDRKSTRLNSSH